MIALESCLTVDLVEMALGMFDMLFPRMKSWHYLLPGTDLTILTQVPTAFRGLGIQRRRWLFGETYPETSSQATSRRLQQWHAAGYELLSKCPDRV